MEIQVQPLLSQRWRMNSECARGHQPLLSSLQGHVESESWRKMPSFLVQNNLQMRPEKQLVPVYSAVWYFLFLPKCARAQYQVLWCLKDLLQVFANLVVFARCTWLNSFPGRWKSWVIRTPKHSCGAAGGALAICTAFLKHSCWYIMLHSTSQE